MTKNEINEARQMMVAQDNALIRGYKNLLTAQEQNVVYYLISKVKPADKDFMTVHTTVRDLCDIFGMSKDSNNYGDLYNALKALRNKSVWAHDKDRNTDELLSWIDTYKIERDTGKVSATLSQSVKPFLIGLKNRGNYTQAELVTYLGMKSKYAKRLYELLKSRVRMKYPDAYSPAAAEYALEELKRLLDAELYVHYRNFKQKVLDPAMAEITAATDIIASYEPVKEGRKTTAIVFSMQLKEPRGRSTALASARAALDKKKAPGRAKTKTGQ